MDRKIEIMSPVGSWESLQAALQAGADSVYFGVEGLNMRARSSNNFTTDDLFEIVRRCRERGVKSYLTLNTVLYDSDLPLMQKIMDAAQSAGINAIIASDVSVMLYARKIGMEVHLSTQLNISNVEALRFYSRFADVVVLARELNLDQVKYIAQAIEKEHITGVNGELVRIEMFCHGALCMAISGKCYLSLHEANSSANRGGCYQICRREYIVKDKESDIELEVDNQYIMSPKDLKTIHFLDKMIEAGVSVFKIEGRARGAEYVYNVTRAYKEAVEACLSKTYSQDKVKEWDKSLREVFNRGFWNGYYLGQRLGEWTKHYGSRAEKEKKFVARGVKYFSRLGVGEFEAVASICEGDELIVTGPTTGILHLTAHNMQVDMKSVSEVKKGEHFSIVVPDKIRPSDSLFKMLAREKENE